MDILDRGYDEVILKEYWFCFLVAGNFVRAPVVMN